MKRIIDDLKWRYATKKFDSTKQIPDEDLDILIESLTLVPTSYGLQPLKIILVKNPAIREKLVDAAYGQRQVADASHLFVICAYDSLEEKHVDAYMGRVARTRNVPVENLSGFSNMIKNTSLKLPTDGQRFWAEKQSYIALGQLLHTCASLRIDATPMEGFKPDDVSQLLNLKELNLHPTLLCPVGYRHEKDSNQHLPKVRKTKDELFITI